MMAACLLAVMTYIPIYEGMEHAAGNNVVKVKSTKNKVTGAISLTAMTLDPTTGMQMPAKEALDPNLPMLVFLLFVQGIYASMIYGPLAAYLVEAFPARIRYTSLSLPYHIGFGIFWRLPPVDWALGLRCDRQHIRGPLLPYVCRSGDPCGGWSIAERDPRYTNLG